MTVKQVTYIIIVATIVALGGYDIYAIIEGGAQSTISCVVINAAYKYPIIPFAVGVLCGHFFWRAEK